jgi:hypothetical protein
MATLAFAAAGAAVGSAVLPAGLTVFGTTLAGATIGAQVGALAGSFVDQALFGTGGQNRTFEGPRLDDLRVTASSEGAPIPRIYGAARVGGQVIWATEFEEQRVTRKASGQSKGGSGGGGGTTQVSYLYYANFAVAIGEGEITGLGRIWADGEEWDLSTITHRLHVGSEDQAPDPFIEAHLGAGNTPAYRGTAYIVFERLALEPFGNRLPQLSFEVFRAVDDFQNDVHGVVIIPGSGEFVYATDPVEREGFAGQYLAENVHTREAATNWQASLDQLARTLPNVQSASLITCWFGSDLRAGSCLVRPGVERAEKITRPRTWAVAGLARSEAYVVSKSDGKPAFGGTPSDDTVIEAIRDLNARGIKPVLTPFLLMDIPAGNTLSDPWSGASGQPPYPWRGRVTVDPAPGQIGSPDKTPAAASQVASFMGTAAVSDFSIVNGTVAYSGPQEWSYRRFILHYAHLAVAAGGVDAFLIGTEMRELTTVRDGADTYPFVAALVQLAADVKTVLGTSTKVTYAADWSEYFGHHPNDGSNDVFFHLDPLWASPAVDCIGIDLYWPLADWRDGDDHLDRATAPSIYDPAYLKSNLAAGEGYDWYYASAADRDAQLRTPITDGAGKPWVFRYKDLSAWWSNAHYDRPGGIEKATPTAWQPQSKPVWLMEIGCPAIDKGANQPNVFYDPKSSESALPYFAHLQRDDFMQRAYLQALIEGLDPNHPGYLAGTNPTSAVYGSPMIATDRIHVYAWDARPSPAFPNDADTWGDAPNLLYVHWLNARMASMPLARVVARIFQDYGFDRADVTALEGMLPGYLIDRVMALREAIQPLELAYFFDTIESADIIRLAHRGRGDPAATVSTDDLVTERADAPLITLARSQETELPQSAKLSFLTAGGDYRRSVAEARRLAGFSDRVATASLAMMLDAEHAERIAETWLHEAWSSRRRATFTLPPSLLAIEPGDMVATEEAGTRLLHRITSIADHGARAIEALSIEPSLYEGHATPSRRFSVAAQPIVGPPDGLFLDLPVLLDDGAETDGFVALHKAPWPGPMAIYQSPGEDGFELAGEAAASATVGTLLDALPVGVAGRVDYATRVRVKLWSGTLTSLSRLSLLEGGNAIAVRGDDGQWEVCQFESAELVGERTYELTGWLRGQVGTDLCVAWSDQRAAAGQPVVVLDSALVRIAVGASGVGRPLNWRYGRASRDISDPSYRQTNHAFAGVGRRPYAPVHLNGTRDVAGNLTISWVRRTRRDGDEWNQGDVLLGEDSEGYEVDVLDGETVVRTLTSTVNQVVYSDSDQIADFGAPQGTVSCRVHQMSASWGRGAPREATV